MNSQLQRVNFSSCLIRFQAPRPGRDAHVTPASFRPPGRPSATQYEVTNTINNFWNSGGSNIPLWLYGGSWAMVYAGVDPGPFVRDVLRPESQDGLNADNVVVSIILPSGMAKLEMVKASTAELPGMHSDLAHALFGINLKKGAPPLTVADFAYTTSKMLKGVIGNTRRRIAPHEYEGMGFTLVNLDDTIQYQFQMEAPYGGIVGR